MAEMNSELTLASWQLRGPMADQMDAHGRNWLAWTRDEMFLQPEPSGSDFGDDRVFFVHDGRRCGETYMAYEQCAGGPTIVYIDEGTPEGALATMAERHGLLLGELMEFRNQWDRDIILAPQAGQVTQ